MRIIGSALAGLGRQGPALLVASLVAGIVVPPLAAQAYAFLPLSAFLLTLGSFLTASLAPPERATGWTSIAVVLVWTGFGVPVLVMAVLPHLALDSALEAGVLLSVLAPPVGSAAAIASMLALRPRLALVASIALTLAAPLSMPALAALLSPGMALDMGHLALRLALIIGAAAVLSRVAVRWRDKVKPVLPDQQAAAGVAVLGLIIVGLATTNGIRAHWTNDPESFLRFLAAAVAVNLGLGIVGTILFWSMGARNALTIGLVSGNRNVTLAWAAAATALPVQAEAYIAACVIPVLALPLAIKSVQRGRRFLARVRLGQAL